MSIGLAVGSYFSINASITISTARHDRGRGLPCCGSARFGDHALAGLPFDLGQEEGALAAGPVSTSTPGVWGTAGGGSASRGGLGVSTTYSTLAAAETVPGRGRSLNVVCSWGASRRNQAKSGYPDSNVRLWGHSGLSGTPLRMSAYSQQRKFATSPLLLKSNPIWAHRDAGGGSRPLHHERKSIR